MPSYSKAELAMRNIQVQKEGVQIRYLHNQKKKKLDCQAETNDLLFALYQ